MFERFFPLPPGPTLPPAPGILFVACIALFAMIVATAPGDAVASSTQKTEQEIW